jgi:hypothetical protein
VVVHHNSSSSEQPLLISEPDGTDQTPIAILYNRDKNTLSVLEFYEKDGVRIVCLVSASKSVKLNLKHMLQKS